jgi:hypothetical protein
MTSPPTTAMLCLHFGSHLEAERLVPFALNASRVSRGVASSCRMQPILLCDDPSFNVLSAIVGRRQGLLAGKPPTDACLNLPSVIWPVAQGTRRRMQGQVEGEWIGMPYRRANSSSRSPGFSVWGEILHGQWPFRALKRRDSQLAAARAVPRVSNRWRPPPGPQFVALGRRGAAG